MWPSGLTLAMTMTLDFQGKIWNLLYLSQKRSDCQEMKSKYIDWTLCLKCDHRVWPCSWPWPWICKVKYGICYISAKWADRHKTKYERINWMLGLKCDQWVWPWLWPWPWIFKVKFLNSCISRMAGPIDVKQKEVNRLLAEPTMSHWPFTTRMALTMDFHGQILK